MARWQDESVSECLFCAIAAGDIPGDVLVRTDRVMAFRDIDPKAPTHILIIPIEHYDDVPSVALADASLAGEIFEVAAGLAAAEGIDQTGHRLVANTGQQGGQTVGHAHVHLLGGRSLGWPPG
jgi:histidine triad (HIT) family protein